jgi:hypothetical protein
VTLTETAEFILARFNPKGAFAAFTEFQVLGELTGVGVESIAMEGEVIEEGEGRIGGWCNCGGGRDVGFLVAVAGEVLVYWEGTGGLGAVSDGFA